MQTFKTSWADDFRLAVINMMIDKIEGEYSDDAADSGGKTKYGITEATARRRGYVRAMRDLPRSIAISIYTTEYWNKLRLTYVAQQYPRVAYKLFDIGVNCGTGRAGQFLQRALNVLNNRGKYYKDIAVDGAIGPASVGAFDAFASRRRRAGHRVLYNALNSLQGAYYISLAEAREKDETWVFGWLRNRIDLPVHVMVDSERYDLNF